MVQQTYTGASIAKDVLLNAVQPNDTELYTEIIAARDGETSLLVKQQAQDTEIADLYEYVGEQIPSLVVSTIPDLRSNAVIPSNGAAYALGYYNAGDGGGGVFYWDSASIETDNTGTIIKATSEETGRWKRPSLGSVNVKWFGAKGDGVTDCISNIYAAISAADKIHFPEGTFLISDCIDLSNDYTIITGEGTNSKIQQATSEKNVLCINGLSGCVVRDLYLICSGDIGEHNEGCGVYVNNSTKTQVSNCVIYNCKSQGILFDDVEDSRIIGNVFIGSPVYSDETNGECGTDIRLQDNCKRNQVSKNQCISGNGAGIAIYTRYITQGGVAGDTCNDNIITDNIIAEAKQYGIWLYRAEESSQSVSHNIVSDNIINGVYGSIKNSLGLGYDFGTGIYVQGGEQNSIIDNKVAYTHKASLSFGETLGPGGIAAINMSSVLIDGNTVENAGMYGIYVKDWNEWGAGNGDVKISNNAVINPAESGIYVRDIDNVSITNNSVFSSELNGIEVLRTISEYNLKYNISGNVVRESLNRGISVSDTQQLLFINNTVDDSEFSSAIDFENVSRCTCSLNMASNGVYGVRIRNGCENFVCASNSISQNTTGLRVDSIVSIADNLVHDNTTDWYNNNNLSSSYLLSWYSGDLPTAVADIGAVSDTTLIIDVKPKDLTENLTVTSNINLDWRSGCTLGGAYTLTIDSAIRAGDYEIFEAELTVAGSAKIGLLPDDLQIGTIIDPSGGGTVDSESRSAIISIIDALQTAGIIQ